jgi:hypothetical protein
MQKFVSDIREVTVVLTLLVQSEGDNPRQAETRSCIHHLFTLQI